MGSFNGRKGTIFPSIKGKGTINKHNFNWTMPDLQRYPWNLYLIKNGKDEVNFLPWKCLILFYYFNYFFFFCTESTNESKQFKWRKSRISYLAIQSFQGYRCNSDRCHLCMEGHMKSTLPSLSDGFVIYLITRKLFLLFFFEF